MRRYVFLLLLWASFVGYSVILCWGIATTRRSGIPTISRMLADSDDLTIFFVVSAALYGEARVLSVTDWSTWWNMAIHVAGGFQIFFLILVAFITIEDNADAHYAVAALAVLFSIIREGLLLQNRWQSERLLLLLNITLLAALMGCGFAFFLLCLLNTDYGELEMASLEYACFWLVIILPLFQFYEIPHHPTVQKGRRSRCC